MRVSHSSSFSTGRAFSAGNEPTTPAWHWAITSSGPDTMNNGDPRTGSSSVSASDAGNGIQSSLGVRGRRADPLQPALAYAVHYRAGRVPLGRSILNKRYFKIEHSGIANGLGPLQDLRRGGRNPQLRGGGAPAAFQSPDGWPQDRGTGKPARHSLVCTLPRRLVADVAGAQVPRTCRDHGGGGAARRGRGIGDPRAGARRRQAVDRCDVRFSLADAAARAIPARARPYPGGDHHPSVSGQRAPP